MHTASNCNNNRLLKILDMGLLREQKASSASHNGGLGYGLRGSDISSLQRTCKSANISLKMTKTAQINHLARVVEPWLLPAPTPEQSGRAKAYLKNVVDRNIVTPRGVYGAMGEMFSIGIKALVAKSSDDERHAAIVFSALMHAQTGFMTDPVWANVWLFNMRRLPASDYSVYLGRCQRQILHDSAILGLRTGYAVATGLLIEKAAHAAVHGTLAAKIVAGISAPILLVMASQAAITMVASVPLAVGAAQLGVEMVKEATSYAQIDFYKDAVLFDCLMQQNSALLNMGERPIQFRLIDNRAPVDTRRRGVRLLNQLSGSLNAYV